jgi:hypothetical protein
MTPKIFFAFFAVFFGFRDAALLSLRKGAHVTGVALFFVIPAGTGFVTMKTALMTE